MYTSQSQEIFYAVVITAAVFCFILVFLFIVIYNYMRVKRLNDGKVFNAVFQSQEIERNRIAREIHDEIGSKISIIKFTNEFILAGSETMETTSFARNNSEAIDDLAKHIRDICRNYASDIIVRNGLRQELQKIIDNCAKVSPVRFHVELNVSEHLYKDEFIINAYRIIQELINNSLKHSQCQNIFISLENEGENTVLRYNDDGIGYPLESFESSEGMGLRNISGRIFAHLGRLHHIRSQQGFGILAEFPKKYILRENESAGS
jgi:signal transduction histidine kinase